MINEKFDMFVYKYLEEFKFPPDARHSRNVIDVRGVRATTANQDAATHGLPDYVESPETRSAYSTAIGRLQKRKDFDTNVKDIGKEWDEQTAEQPPE